MQNLEEIYNVLKNNPKNYLGYKMLGEFYQGANINQAFLSYEQALGFCDDMAEKAVLIERMNLCRKDSYFQVNPVSFIILSYNARDMMIDCLESIRRGCVPGSYETVVVDNASQDGIRDYLVKQKDIILQLNDHNTSFAEGCNQGVKLANPYNDILLLNNDTIVPPLALFYMRMALYSSSDIGSVGPMTNDQVSFQAASGDYKTKDEWMTNAEKIHLPTMNSCENKAWLAGFALLIRRKAWDNVGNLDEKFQRGNYEDNDYEFRLLKAGYRNVLCHNAFVYHYGYTSMGKDIAAQIKSLSENKRKLVSKLGFDFDRYLSCYKELVDMIDLPKDSNISVLEIGCGFGQTLSKIKYEYPYAEVFGVENNLEVAILGKNVTNVYCLDVEKNVLPFEKKSFDYIFLTDIFNRLENVKRTVNILKEYLKENGKFVVLIQNIFNGENFVKILKGGLESVKGKDLRIRHFYTINETLSLLSETGFSLPFVFKIFSGTMNISEEEKKMLGKIKAFPNMKIGEDFNIVSYIIPATLKSEKKV